jgi:hypothetical protein
MIELEYERNAALNEVSHLRGEIVAAREAHQIAVSEAKVKRAWEWVGSRDAARALCESWADRRHLCTFPATHANALCTRH